MTTLAWVVIAGLAMSCLALTGSVTLFMSEDNLRRLTLPLVGFAAGSLFGGAVFHMVPASVDALDNGLPLYAAVATGFTTFFVLEQLLWWHHCHRPVSEHRPLGYLILLADGAHNLIGGLAVGGAFVVDTRLGVVTWFVAAAHEVPQELGDFGILVHSGWKPRAALAYNLGSALTFLVGALLAYGASGAVDVTYLVPFAAGNFVYIAAADLIPQLTATDMGVTPGQHRVITRAKIEQTIAFAAGLVLLYATTALG